MTDGASKGGMSLDDHALALTPLTELARRALPPPVFAHESALAYDRFTNATETPTESARAVLPPWTGWAAAAVLAVVGAVGTWRLTVTPPLTVVVAGGAVDEGGFVHTRNSGEASEPSLRFSDGTEVKLGPSSRARVAETTARGARVLLEDGRAQARVSPRKGAEWVFDAGPCRIHVTGTQFDMHWSSPDQVLDVRLYHGSVTVQGPPASAGVPMRAGQHLVMDVRQGSVRLTDLEDAAREAPAPGVAPTPVEVAPAVTPPKMSARATSREAATPVAPATASTSAVNALAQPLAPAGGPRRDEGWPARVLAGDFRGVTEEAERRGIDNVLRGESAANLMALADAARYAGASPLAQRALLKVRGRFPRTGQAHKAAFLLGRMAEDQHGNLGKALEWYDTYLADAPDDAFRAEAMGRRMTATLRFSGPTRARFFATEYLRSYPQGAYAQPARAILSR